MKKYLVILALCMINSIAIAQKELTLPNGWSLSPAGRSLPVGDLPLNIAVSSSKRYIAVTNNGQGRQSLQLIDVRNEKLLDNITVAKAWLGLKFSSDEKYLFASGGNDNWILQYAIINDKLVLRDSIKLGDKWPNKISPAGIDIDDARHLLYVVTKDNDALYVIDLLTKKIKLQIPLDAEAYTCLLSPDKKKLYISIWGAQKVRVFNTESSMIEAGIIVGDHPMICA